ncbi:unnamed protein product [Urochloa decumbens]|uniref:Uncharacterized protein n=1 Tax=Urochloa decumbens TaxID=240449 RepID=A0ABC9AR12_9POAL
MEPEAAWIPWDSRVTYWSMEVGDLFQMPNMIMEPEVWAPANPVECNEIFGRFLQTSIPTSSSSTGGQLVKYPAATQNNLIEKTVAQEFEEAAREFKVAIDLMKMKINRYPPSLRAFDEWYTVPRMVAIGPYHHVRLRDQPKQVEKVKHVAAHHCIRESGHSIEEVYAAITSAAHDGRRLYDKDVMARIGDDDFLTMMFYDACFLVQYMLWCTHGAVEMDASLRSFLDFNRKVLRHDLMLFENQLPWLVVEAVMRFRPVDLADFISDWRDYLQDRKVLQEKPVVLDDSYKPPHLLGLLWFYMVGRSTTKMQTRAKLDSIRVSVSAIELAEIGITLTAAKDTIRGILSAELSLVPLSLDDERASFLFNMAALELCTTSNFLASEDEDSAVCSYLLLLSMLVHREEDVQELRTKHLLQGGAGLINKDALDFFTRLQSLPLRGSCYVRVMVEIEKYKVGRRMRTKVHAFLYKNKRTILTVISIIGVLVSILGTLASLKAHSKL